MTRRGKGSDPSDQWHACDASEAGVASVVHRLCPCASLGEQRSRSPVTLQAAAAGSGGALGDAAATLRAAAAAARRAWEVTARKAAALGALLAAACCCCLCPAEPSRARARRARHSPSPEHYDAAAPLLASPPPPHAKPARGGARVVPRVWGEGRAEGSARGGAAFGRSPRLPTSVPGHSGGSLLGEQDMYMHGGVLSPPAETERLLSSGSWDSLAAGGSVPQHC